MLNLECAVATDGNEVAPAGSFPVTCVRFLPSSGALTHPAIYTVS